MVFSRLINLVQSFWILSVICARFWRDLETRSCDVILSSCVVMLLIVFCVV